MLELMICHSNLNTVASSCEFTSSSCWWT